VFALETTVVVCCRPLGLARLDFTQCCDVSTVRNCYANTNRGVASAIAMLLLC